MKISITFLTLLGLSCGHETIVGRAPPTDPPSKVIKELIVNGIKDWGPAANLKPPGSPKPPLREMPFGLGMPKSPHKYPPGKTGVSRIPGSPLGPKKCRPCKRKRQLCCGNVVDSTKSSKGPNGGSRPAQKSSKIRLTKAVGKAAAFTLLAPHARDLLEAIKDSPVGAPVRWFDDAMATIQEAIGGPQRDDVVGNDLKALFICALKGRQESEITQGRKSHFCTPTADEFKKDFEDAANKGELDKLVCTCAYVEASWEYPQLRGGSPSASEVSDRMCKAFFSSDQYGELQWKRGLNELLDVCSNIETNPDSLDEGSLKAVKERCTALQTQVAKVEKGARKPVEGIPKLHIGTCKCDAYKLSGHGTHCGNNCRAFYALGGWRLNIGGEQPLKDAKKKVEEKPDPSADERYQEGVKKYCAEVRAQIEEVSPETLEAIEDPAKLEKDIEEEDAATELNEDAPAGV